MELLEENVQSKFGDRRTIRRLQVLLFLGERSAELKLGMS